MRFMHIAAVLLCLLPGCCARAQAVPAPLTLVNPYPVTGAADIAGTTTMTRALRAMQVYATPSTTDALLQHLQRWLVSSLGVEVTVIRNPREGGTAAAKQVGNADTPTLLFGGSGLTADTTLPAMRGLQPAALVARIPLVLTVRSENAAKGIARLLGQARGALLQIGTPGERTPGQQLALLLQRDRIGTIATVTYNGGNGALRGLLARQVDAALIPLPAVLPYAAGGRMRILAIAADARHALLPGVPTFAESGLTFVTVSGWHGLFASPAVGNADAARLRNALAAALRSDDARAALSGLGYVAEFGAGGVLQKALEEELRRPD